MTNSILVSGRRIPPYFFPVLATLIVAGSLFFSGIYSHGAGKDIDARFFYAAAKCWASGSSPYQPEVYDAVFRSIFGSAPEALFVAYLPTLMLVVMPMAAFDWTHAKELFALMNFGAAMVLYWACYRLVRELVGAALRPKHWLWIVLGSTIGGIAGTLFTGQTSVFVTAACAVALVGCRLQRSWLTVIGLVVASAKPHLSGPLLLFIVVFEPTQRRAVAIAVAIVAVIFGYAAAVDPDLLRSYIDSIRIYGSLATNDPSKQVGFAALLTRFGVEQKIAGIYGAVALASLLGFIGWYVWSSRRALTQLPLAVMLLVLSIGLARSIQGYDLCCYAIAIALLATVEFRFQMALLMPAAIVWRPVLVVPRNSLPEVHNLAATLAWLALVVATVVMAGRAMRRHHRRDVDAVNLDTC